MALLIGSVAVMLPTSSDSKTLFQEVKAEPSTKPTIERGKDFQINTLGDGTQKITLGLPIWVFDNDAKAYVPHKVSVINSTYLEIQSGLIAWKISKSNAVIADPDMKEERAVETWLPFGNITLDSAFQSQSVAENATGVYVTNHYQTAYKGDNVGIDIIYAIIDGEASQRIVKVTGLSNGHAKALKLDRVWSSLDIDTAVIDGQQDSASTITKSKDKSSNPSVLKANAAFHKQGKLVLLENLETANDHIKKIDYQKDKVVFTYDGWTTGSNVVLIDDTATLAPATDDGNIATNAATGSSCPTTSYEKQNTQSTMNLNLPGSASTATLCTRAYGEWDTSSVLDGSQIISVVLNFTVFSVSNARNCDYYPMQFQPTLQSNQTIYLDAGNGTAYVSNDATCTTTGTAKTVTLGSQAATDLQNKLTSNWFGLGIRFTNETRDGSTHNVKITAREGGGSPKPTIIVTYALPTVTIPIKLAAASGSSTPESVGVAFTVTGSGCTGATHDGNPQTQNFVCSASSTITVTVPTDTGPWRFRFSDGRLSESFTSCSSGTCSSQVYTYYRQYNTTFSLPGLDSKYFISQSRAYFGSTTAVANGGGNDWYLRFDGTTKDVTIANNTDITLNNSIEIFMSFSSNDISGDSGSGRGLFTKYRDANNLYAGVVDNTGSLGFRLVRNGVLYSVNTGSGVITTSKHYNVLFEWNGTGSNIYVDGTAYNNAAPGANTANTALTDLTIGKFNVATGRWSGTINNFMLWKDHVFSTTERNNLFNGNPLIDSSMKVYLLFNDASGTTAADYSGHGNSGTLNGSPTWQRGIWTDENGAFAVPYSLDITVNQDRFATYTSGRSFTVTTNSTKTFTFQHEYNTLFRVKETHLQDLYAPMPLSVYTGTVTTANGTALSLTFNTEVTDDYMQPAGGAIWVKNGTTSWSNYSWRGVIANASGSASITSYANFDVQSSVKHYGIVPGQYHFRYGVSSGTTTTMTFNSNAGTIAFNGTAPAGQHRVVVEYLPQLYSSVQSILINGVQLPGANFTITSDDTVSPPVSVLTMDAHFSTDTFLITFASASGGGSSGGGGGGGGSSGGSDNPSPIQPTVGSAIGLRIDPVIYQMGPGDSLRQNITIYWQGNTVITIDSITFGASPEWFQVNEPLPVDFVLQPGQTQPMNTIPLTVRLPTSVSGSTLNIPMTIKAHSGSSESTVAGTVQIIVGAPTNNLGYYATAAFFVAFLGGIGYAVLRQGRHR